MSPGSDDDFGRLLTDLATTLRDLEEEVSPTTRRGFPRPPTPSELLRFTSEVTIPAAILVLRTNVEALKILRRALRMADGRPPTTEGDRTKVRERAERVTRATLTRLDGALEDLQSALAGRPADDDTRDLLEEARHLSDQVEERLAERTDDGSHVRNNNNTQISYGSDEDGETTDESGVNVNVDAELQSLKDDVDAGDGDEINDG